MLDKDLAELYGVAAKRLNEAVKRNLERFPSDFMFEITKEEIIAYSRSQFATLKTARGRNIKYMPYAFTEQGIAMLSSVLNSPKAIQINIQIIRIFTKMREMVESYRELTTRVSQIEKLLNVLIKQEEKPKGKIGFDTGN